LAYSKVMDVNIMSDKETQLSPSVGLSNGPSDSDRKHARLDVRNESVTDQPVRSASEPMYSRPLPAAVVERIVKHLPIGDLLRAAAVSTTWKAGCQRLEHP
jgi:hypothetical protein